MGAVKMADYSDSKRFGDNQSNSLSADGRPTNAYPVESVETTNLFGRIEPILTPELFTSRYLKGIDGLDYNNEELKDEIKRAINAVELDTKLFLSKVQFKERLPFDRSLYQNFVYMKTNNGPILSIESIQIESSNGENIYKLPVDWIEMGFAHKRQINLIPILSIFGASGLQDGQPSNAGLVFLQAVNNFRWMPAFFTVIYTAGVCHKDGQLPQIINELVGLHAAIEVLSNMQTRLIYNSTSISQDGISQSASGPGSQTYQPRIDKLKEDYGSKLAKIKAKFSQKYFLSNI